MVLTWSHDHIGSDTKSKVIYKVFIGYGKNIAAHIPCLYCMTNCSAARLFGLELPERSGMCLCTCHESFTLGFLGMCGPPCIVADIFSSVFQEALSLSLFRGCSFLTHFALDGWLLVFITLHWLIVLLMITTLYGQGSRLRSARRPGGFSLS